MRLWITLLALAIYSDSFAQPQLVRDIAPGAASAVNDNINFSDLIYTGKTLLFKANDGSSGVELWNSDGTETGTNLVRDIYSGTDKDGPSDFYIVFDSVLYFLGESTANGREIWRSDGTGDGTYLFWDACTGTCSGPFYGNYSPEFVEYMDKIFFMSSTAASGRELFYSNGDSAVVVLLKEISSGAGSSSPGKLAAWNNLLFFSASEFSAARELWMSDGTTNGTQLLKDINPGGFAASDPDNLTPVGAQLFFSANLAGSGRELWKTDGTEAGTVMVKDINPGAGNGVSNEKFGVLGDKVLFVANNGVDGNELWVSDGTEDGTQMLRNIGLGGANSLARLLAPLGNKYLFAADDFNIGSELWITDGTPAGTQLVKDIYPGLISGVQYGGPVYNGKMYFVGQDNTAGIEIWQTDGTTAGTTLVADVNPGFAGSAPSNLVIAGNTLYFFATTNETGRELWKLDLNPPVAQISAPDTVCQDEPAIFVSSSTADNWSWLFGPDAQPTQVQGPGPHTVLFNAPGTKTAQLIVSNAFGTDTAEQTITVLPLPKADLNYQTNDLMVNFFNNSTDAETYAWDFGDGQTSNESNPIYTYSAPGTYTVSLTVSNSCGDDEISIVLTLTSSTHAVEAFDKIITHPNPAKDHFWVDFEKPVSEPGLLSLYNSIGGLVLAKEVSNGTDLTEIYIPNGIAPGIYFLRIQLGHHVTTVSVVLMR